MKYLNDTDSFINRMMEETYALQGEGVAQNPQELLEHFNDEIVEKESSLEEILKDTGAYFFKINFCEESKFYKVNEWDLSFPSNWSIFNTINQTRVSDISMIIELTEFDHHQLSCILNKFLPKRTRLYLLASSDEIYFACPRIDDSNFESLVAKYFNLKNEKTEDFVIQQETQLAAA